MQVSPSSSNESRPLSSSNSSAPPSTQHSQPVSGHEVTPVPEAKQEKETFFEKIRSLFCKNVSNKAAALESSQTPQSPVILKPVPSEFANSKPKVSSYNVREALNIVDESGALRKDWNRLAGITKEDKLKQEIPTSFVTDKARASYQLGQQPLQNLDNPNPQFESFLQEALNKPGMPKVSSKGLQRLRYQLQDLATQRLFGMASHPVYKQYTDKGWNLHSKSDGDKGKHFNQLRGDQKLLQKVHFSFVVEGSVLKIIAEKKFLVSDADMNPRGFDAIRVELPIDLTKIDPVKGLVDKSLGMDGTLRQHGFTKSWEQISSVKLSGKVSTTWREDLSSLLSKISTCWTNFLVSRGWEAQPNKGEKETGSVNSVSITKPMHQAGQVVQDDAPKTMATTPFKLSHKLLKNIEAGKPVSINPAKLVEPVVDSVKPLTKKEIAKDLTIEIAQNTQATQPAEDFALLYLQVLTDELKPEQSLSFGDLKNAINSAAAAARDTKAACLVEAILEEEFHSNNATSLRNEAEEWRVISERLEMMNDALKTGLENSSEIRGMVHSLGITIGLSLQKKETTELSDFVTIIAPYDSDKAVFYNVQGINIQNDQPENFTKDFTRTVFNVDGVRVDASGKQGSLETIESMLQKADTAIKSLITKGLPANQKQDGQLVSCLRYEIEYMANQWLNGVHVDETLGKKYSQQGCTLQQRDREHGSYDISLDGQMLTIQTRDFWTISDADHLSIVKGYDARNITLQIDLSKVGPELLLSKDCVKIKIERNGFCKHFSDVDVLSAGQVAKAVAIEVATSAQSSQNGSELLPIYLESLYSKLKPGESLARRDIKTALDQAVATVREEIIAGQQDKEVQDRLNEMVKAFDAMHPITPDIQKST